MSNKKQKSLDDIVEEMRRGLDKSWHDIDREWARSLPDRIEAVAKRERAIHAMTCEANERLRERLEIAIENNKRTEVGNAAALREALEHIDKLTREFNVGNYSRPDYTQWVLDSIRFALDKPARNCDRYVTAEGAQKDFLAEPCEHPCGDCTIYDINNKCGVQWLFAPANEKGEGDGR